MTFPECVLACSQNAELVAQFDRLRGTHLGEIGYRSNLARMVDEATGRDADALIKFVEFVWETVWTRLPHTAEEN